MKDLLSLLKPAPTLRDILAGFTVALVLIPQSIAYAELAGLPPIHGLYAAILPLIAAALFASSPWLQTGPVAMTSILIFGALSTLAVPGSDEYISLAALLALTVGLARIVISVARAGFIVYLMSQPVLNGFTTAAAVLILSTQIPAFFGVETVGGNVLSSLLSVFSQPEQWSLQSMLLGFVTLFLLLIGKRIHALFPGVLAAVIFGIAYQRLIGCDCVTIGSIPSDLPGFSFSLPWHRFDEMILPGFVIALVGFAEPAAIARTLAASSRKPWSANREFLSQGVANLVAGISSAFPVGGSFSRTLISHAAGATSRWSGAITGLVVLGFLPVANIMSSLPKPVLAAIIIAAVSPLIKFGPLLQLMRSSRAQSVVAWVTFLLTLILSPRIDLAVLCGMGLGIAVHLWRERRINIVSRYSEHTLRLEPTGVLFFGSANSLDETIVEELVKHPDVKALILDLRRLGRIDYTGALVIQRVASEAELAGLSVRVIPGQPPQGARLLRRVFGKDSNWISKP
jgi:SulP family sulfate permease